ncbi:MAG: CHASE3 domain-containing protein [Rhizobiaceae bacterium]
MQLLPLVLIFAILVALVGTRSVLIESQETNNQAVRAAFDLDRHIVEVLSLLQDAETGQRGYLLTSEDAYLEPYRHAAEALPGQIAAVRDATKADPSRLQRIDRLDVATNEKLAELGRVIDLFRSGEAAQALAIVRSDEGKQIMDRARLIVDEIRADERQRLQAELDDAADIGEWLRRGSVAAGLAIVALAIFGVLDMRRRMRSVITAHAGIEQANRALVAEMDSRRAAEDQVRQMQKLEAVGQLTGGIAHDFNNMLAVIMSALNLMQRKLARGETDVGKFVDAAIDAAERAAKLTGRLLAFSRQQPLAPQVVDANRLISSMSDLLRRTLGETVQIETVLGGGLWRTKADPSQVENAVLNLAVNGRDAMPDGGKLTIETGNAHLDDRYAAAHHEVPAGQYVLIAVTDTGTGMSSEVMGRAFEPFFTTKPVNKGTGLGLSQVFGFVKQSGGHVKIYSEAGEGTTVKLYLPRFFGEDEEGVAPAAEPLLDVRPTETILVVEDDERVRTGTVDTLRELGYAVIHAASAEDALKKLETTPGVTLLFTDIVMPVMNGRKLADEAVTRHPGLKVLYTTGFTRNAVVHNGVLDHGVNFIAKPFTIDQIARKLREVLDA